MKKENFCFCTFRDNLILKVLEEQPHDRTLFVFPTENSKLTGIREFLKQWRFTETHFLTMEQFKDLSFLSQRRILKEDKRSLAFYASLSSESKNFFKIKNYFQSIEIARHFFEFWEEFNDEMIEDNINPERFARANAELLEWQLLTFHQLLKIKSNYQKFIQEKGFDDIIFLFQPDNLNLKFFNDFDRIVIVNQFYYTRLEQFILEKLNRLGKQIKIYYQLPESLVDWEHLKVDRIELKALKEFNTQKISIFECPNQFTMIAALIHAIENDNIYEVVDVSFARNPYSKFLSPEKFAFNQNLSFTNSSVFRFFQKLAEIVDSLIWDPIEKNILLPIQSILNAAQSDEVYQYLAERDGFASQELTQEKILCYIYSLIDDDFKYIDFWCSFFKIIPEKKESMFVYSLIDFLNRLLDVKNISGLIDFIDAEENGIEIDRLFTDREKRYSNIKEVFYQALSDFYSIEQIDIIDKNSWRQYFGDYVQKDDRIILASGILKLFVNYLKAKKIKYNFDLNQSEDQNSFRVSITDLENTRNIQYRKVAILDVTEDIIPSARRTPFLFTEKQREALGLKTYEEIREWEKYYFFRLLLSAREVYLFSQKNIERNIDASSFVEEIRLHLQHIIPCDKVLEDTYYRVIYGNFLHNKDYTVSPAIYRKPDFFQIPLDKSKDFPHNSLDLTAYELTMLLKNPFAFYFQHLCGLKRVPEKVDHDLSVALIGKVVHDIIHHIWSQLIEDFHGPLFGFNYQVVDGAMIDRAIEKVVFKPLNYFRFPKNYSMIYFKKIVIPIIKQGVESFFKLLENLPFNDRRVEVIPEKEYGSIEEREYKQLIAASENDLQIDVRIRGRADLRIHVLDEKDNPQQYYIFDYKTGSGDREQLIFYELFYYLIERPDIIDRVNSYFFNVMKEDMQSLNRMIYRKSKKDVIELFRQKLVEAVNRLALQGFGLPEQKSKLDDFADISRKDLYLAMKSGNR